MRNGTDAASASSTWARAPLRAAAVEAALAGGASAADAAAVAAEGTEPSADLNASVEYRQHLARVLVRPRPRRSELSDPRARPGVRSDAAGQR